MCQLSSGKDDLEKGAAQNNLRTVKDDREGLATLGFSDAERSLGKKNVYSGGQHPIDQYGEFLHTFGATVAETAPHHSRSRRRHKKGKGGGRGEGDPAAPLPLPLAPLAPLPPKGPQAPGGKGGEGEEEGAGGPGQGERGDDYVFDPLRPRRDQRYTSGFRPGLGGRLGQNRRCPVADTAGAGAREEEEEEEEEVVEEVGEEVGEEEDHCGRRGAAWAGAGAGGQYTGYAFGAVKASYAECMGPKGVCPPFPGTFPDEAQVQPGVSLSSLQRWGRRGHPEGVERDPPASRPRFGSRL